MADFHHEDVPLPGIQEDRLSIWLESVAEEYAKRIESLAYIFCSDEYLHRMNVEYLQHDTLTDIITFDLAEAEGDDISAECYISVERTRENATSFGVSPEEELRRVMVHGLLHLCGLGDKAEHEQGIMRAAEQRALAAYG